MFTSTPRTTTLTLVAALLSSLPAVADAARPRTSAGTRAEVDAPHGRLTDRMIIRYRDGADPVAAAVELRRSANRRGVSMRALRAGAQNTQVLTLSRPLPVDNAAAMAAEIAATNPGVEFAEADRLLGVEVVPNDPMYPSQWDLMPAASEVAALNTPGAWQRSSGSGVVVSVIDTGYRPHPDLLANLVSGYDFITDAAIANDGGGRDADASDPGDFVTAAESSGGVFAGCGAYNSSWHGTHVAGTIAAVANNASGITGVAYGARLQPSRVLGKCGGYTSDIAAAILWAAGGSVAGLPANPTPARVINLSLGGAGVCGPTLQGAINAARARGAVVVVAAGNSNTNASGFAPANCNGVVTVAAVGRSGARAYYSNFGASVDVAAPGGDMSTGSTNGILSTLNTGTTTPGTDTYGYYQGTSMAAPHVAGVVALMRARNASLTPDEIEARLRSSTRRFPAACNACGTGIVDAQAAVTVAAAAPVGANDAEPNNTLARAQAIPAYARFNGVISAASDIDWLRVSVPAGRKLTTIMTPNSAANFDIAAFDSRGALLSSSSLGAGVPETLTVANNGASTSTFHIRVTRVAGTGSYSLITAQ